MPALKRSRNPDYKDLNLDFEPHPITGDIQRLFGVEAVKRSVRNLVLTNFYERPFRSSIGSNALKMLFENNTTLAAINLERTIRDVIENFEPRVTLNNIKIFSMPDNNAFVAAITFTINNSLEPVTTSVILERIR